MTAPATLDDLLLAAARDRTDADTRLFARLLAHRPDAGGAAGLGLSRSDLAALVDTHFPGFRFPSDQPEPPPLPLEPETRRFLSDVTTLLLAHRASDAPQTRWLAAILSHACLRPDHLWRDLGLSGRDDVTALLSRHFPRLAGNNVMNWRWKKFLAYAAHDLAGRRRAAAPGCTGCEDHHHCYPPTDDTLASAPLSLPDRRSIPR